MEAKEQIRQWWIYKITNPNGRIYIGKTKTIDNRINQYKYGRHKKQILIARSIYKYGWTSHSFEVIDNFNSNLSYANDKEMFWIRSWMSNMNKYPEQNGMNLTDGGDGSAGFKHSEEWKKELSKIHKGKQHKLGKKVSEETKAKISKFFKGRKRRVEEVATYLPKMIETKGKKVIQCSNVGEFYKEYKSINEAVRETNFSKTQMRRVLKGEKQLLNGWRFKYKQLCQFQ